MEYDFNWMLRGLTKEHPVFQLDLPDDTQSCKEVRAWLKELAESHPNQYEYTKVRHNGNYSTYHILRDLRLAGATPEGLIDSWYEHNKEPHSRVFRFRKDDPFDARMLKYLRSKDSVEMYELDAQDFIEVHVRRTS